MGLNRRRWAFVIVFWLLFLASLGLAGHYRWLDTAWVFAGLLFAVVASVFSIVEMLRHRGGSGEYIYYRGVPRCMRWFVLSDEEYAKDIERQKIADEKRLTSDRK